VDIGAVYRAIAKKPKRDLPERDPNKKPTMIRVAPDLLERIDQGAKRLGISRSAFICSSTAEKLERMGIIG
jgi:hypothetical protein